MSVRQLQPYKAPPTVRVTSEQAVYVSGAVPSPIWISRPVLMDAAMPSVAADPAAPHPNERLNDYKSQDHPNSVSHYKTNYYNTAVLKIHSMKMSSFESP